MTADPSLFVFGHLATPEHLAQEARLQRTSLFHGSRLAPPDPQPGQPVDLLIEVGAQLGIDRIAVRYVIDGSAVPRPDAPSVTARLAETVWDDLTWQYVDRWIATLPGLPDGSRVRYTIAGTSSLTPRTLFADAPNDGKKPDVFGYDVDSRAAPDWIHDAVIYQIFVDRFFHHDPDFGRPPRDISEIYGGTIPGVADKLLYLQDLGVTALWLTPIFECETYHGYDALDFERVADRLGGPEALLALVSEAHQGGIRIILDFAPNHCSWHNPRFLDAQQNETSIYRDWFTFADWPHTYDSFFGHAQLPQFNTHNLEVVEYLSDVAVSLVERFGVDGFRLDYALGPPLLFFTELQHRLKAARPDCFTVAEATTSPAGLRRFEGRLDGCLDFPTLQKFREFFIHQSIDAAAFHRYLERSAGSFGPTFVRPTFLDNHDMNRFLWAAGDDVRKLILATACQLTLPQPPIIYYGTEVGLSQQVDVAEAGFGASRLPMLWDARQDQHLLQTYRTLIRARHDHPALRHGDRQAVAARDGLYAYLCKQDEDAVLVALNNGDQTQDLQLPWLDGEDLLSGSRCRGRAHLAAFQATIVPTSGPIPD